MRKTIYRSFLIAATLVTGLSVRVLIAENVLSVDLQSGRTFTGQIDIRTDANRLWLRYGSRSTHIIRPIDWERIVRARLDGNEIEVADLRSMSESLRSEPKPMDELAGEFHGSPSDIFGGMHESAHSDDQTDAQRAKAALGFSERVRSIRIDAYLSNWDQDAQPDGLVVRIYPLTANGRIARVGGTLRVVLKAARSQSPQLRNSSAVANIGQWSRQIRADDTGDVGAPIRLAFQRGTPESDDDVAAYGLVHVQLAIPGHGVFAASQDGVRIRRYSPTLDAQQRSRRQRK